MASLAPDASVAEIEEEIDFHQILINSLDPGADDFESHSQKLQQQMEELQRRLVQAQNSPHRSLAQRPSPSMLSPQQQRGSSDFHNEYGSPPQNTAKRAGSSLVPDEDRPYKRQTPSPLPHTDQMGASSHAERVRMRQLAAEAAIRRQSEQSRADEEFARRMSQNWGSGSATAGPSSQPAYQATLGPNGQVLPSIRSVMADNGNSSSHQAATQLARVWGQPQIKSESRPQDLAIRGRESTDFVDLTADSDDEQAPIPPHQQVSSLLPLPQNMGAGMQNYRSTMPGAFNSYAISNPSNMLHRQPSTLPSGSAHFPTYQQSLQAAAMARVQAASRSALNGMQAANNHVFSQLGQLNNLINGSRMHPQYLDEDDDDDEVLWQGTTYRPGYVDPYANHADLFRDRYAQLEQYNPEKTKEELNALLHNIRPDEELPDHLLVATPEAMTIKLHKYQELGLTWLQKAEEGSNKGGILADDMGLGKTIQMISLIVTRKSEDRRCKTTLIVAPVALLRQWKQEIEQKVKGGRHALTVFIHHGTAKKAHYQDLMVYDIVITTFGSLAAELKRLEKFSIRKRYDPEARPRKDEQCALIDPDCRWYRVILDEAQCIKNKTTQTAKAAFILNATYRFCMTGTPMMNNVTELFSLIHFLRIRPYNSWENFNRTFARPLKGNYEDGRVSAMKMLQVLCKAMMLRRTKKSEYRGKPILVLPERTTEVDHATFDEDERSLYTSLETRTQITFNKYLRAGTVGRSYSAILVLLLRLRQACCHPHLIKDFSIGAAADLSDEALLDLARELSESVVTRIKATDGNFECPICMDACINPAIFLPCGHDTCRDCYVKLADPTNALREGNENGGQARCPHCRGNIDPKRITDFISFKRVHMPELLTEEEKAQFGVDDGSETESEEDDSETESETEDKTLNGFIVTDDVEDCETQSEAEEADVEDELIESSSKEERKSRRKSKKSKKSKGKGKGKAKAATQLTLAKLKKRANGNVKARKKYLRRLREDYKDSAKIRKMMDLLSNIIDAPEDDEQSIDRKPDLNLPPEKILVFSQWTSLLDLCEIEIDRKGWDYRRYDGSMNAKMRGDAVDQFKDPNKEVRIMLVSLKAGNAGLNLNIANQVIILDPFWNPYIEEQAIDRAHRIGQLRPVKVHRVLVENTVEDRILALQDSKRKLIEQALDEQQASQLSRLGARELAFLFGVNRNLSDPV